MFQFSRFPSLAGSRWFSPWGFPIRISWILTVAHTSSMLFAVYHVLLRHCTPRHPPCALSTFVLAETRRPAPEHGLSSRQHHNEPYFFVILVIASRSSYSYTLTLAFASLLLPCVFGYTCERFHLPSRQCASLLYRCTHLLQRGMYLLTCSVGEFPLSAAANSRLRVLTD
jgi:hypothetical protein